MSVPPPKARVLIVDDEAAFRMMLTLLLQKNGFECVAAPDGEAAVELLNRDTFDVGVFDIMMPGMNGGELASIAREVSPDMRLIAVSALACSPELTDFGFEAALQKPFKVESLVRICRSFAERKPDSPASSAELN